MANTFESVRVITLTAGNCGMPGAPILRMALMIDPTDGTVQGKGEITQALAPPEFREGSGRQAGLQGIRL